MSLCDKAAEELRRQIKEGAYAFRNIPSERELASRHGISYMTARRAINKLVDEKMLMRNDVGRVEIVSASEGGASLRVALLTPAFDTNLNNRWRVALDRVAARAGASVRPVTYVHWSDAILWDALKGFDGAFIMANNDALTPALAERMRALPRPPVIVGEDFSAHGLPSVVLYPPVWTQLALSHLADAGYGKIACVNVHPHIAPDIKGRIGQWRFWSEMRDRECTLLDDPVPSYEIPVHRACRLVGDYLDRGGDAEALFCTTLGAASGAYRALYERGLKPGTDIGVATVDGEGMADMMTPSLTDIAAPAPDKYLRLCFQWLKKDKPWPWPLAMQSEAPQLAARESSRR